MQVEEFVEYVVENGMMNFSELAEMFPREIMYTRLKNSITEVAREKEIAGNILGQYNYNSKKIVIQCDRELSKSLFEERKKIGNVAIHEGVHALLRHGPNFTGCMYLTRDIDKISYIKLFEKKRIKALFSKKSLLEKIRAMNRIFNICMKPKNAFINEGLTEWITR